MDFIYITITDKEKLKKFKEEILQLFEKCFSSSLGSELWDWAYLNNPFGAPVVSLCLHENKVIGHYAIIPIEISNDQLVRKAGLSMTTMVDEKYRRHGIFPLLANRVYEKAYETGYDLVYGFPNKKSAPGFKKRLQWQLDPIDHIITVSGRDLIKSIALQVYVNTPGKLSFNVKNQVALRWRLSKPKSNYYHVDSVIKKTFDGNQMDIVFLDIGYENEIEDKEIYNILIDSSIDTFTGISVSEYQFGYKILNPNILNFDIKKDLLLSDVF